MTLIWNLFGNLNKPLTAWRSDKQFDAKCQLFTLGRDGFGFLGLNIVFYPVVNIAFNTFIF